MTKISENPLIKTLFTDNKITDKIKPSNPNMIVNALVSTIVWGIFAGSGFGIAALGISCAVGAAICTGFTLGNTIGAISGLVIGIFLCTKTSIQQQEREEDFSTTSPKRKKRHGQGHVLPKGTLGSPDQQFMGIQAEDKNIQSEDKNIKHLVSVAAGSGQLTVQSDAQVKENGSPAKVNLEENTKKYVLPKRRLRQQQSSSSQ